MSQDFEDKMAANSEESAGRKSGREKQKIRIKYRQRVKIKRRPKGYKLKRYWRKNKRNILSYAIIILLLAATLFMVVQVTRQQIERNLHVKKMKLRVN